MGGGVSSSVVSSYRKKSVIIKEMTLQEMDNLSPLRGLDLTRQG